MEESGPDSCQLPTLKHTALIVQAWMGRKEFTFQRVLIDETLSVMLLFIRNPQLS